MHRFCPWAIFYSFMQKKLSLFVITILLEKFSSCTKMVKPFILIFLLTLGLTVAYRPKPAYHPRSRRIHQRESDYEGSALHKHTAYLPETCIPECNGTEPIAFLTFELKCPEKLTSGMKEDIGNVQLFLKFTLYTRWGYILWLIP